MTATAPRNAPASPPPVPPPAAPPPARPVFARLVGLLASMKLAVWLVLTLALLTWLGTLAQTDRATQDVQREYFESWFVKAELPLSFWGTPLFDTDGDGRGFPLVVPLPGAYPVLMLLFVNLVVGGLVRLRWKARNSGILVIHVGIALLLAAGFVKLNYSFSGSMPLYEYPKDGNVAPNRSYESSRFASFHDYELALLVDRGSTVEERVVPEQVLWAARDDGSVTLRAGGLPFAVQVHHWIDFCSVRPKGPMVQTTTPVVDGVFLKPEAWKPGVQPKAEQETAGCYVTIFPDESAGGAAGAGKRIDGILWGTPEFPSDRNRYPMTFTVQGQRYGLDLRHVTHDLPFTLRLDRFQKLDHPGTMSPKDFRSFVTVIDRGEPREAQIFMNNPLRTDGYVVYQANFGPDSGPPYYSGFEVAYNPSDIWPALACGVIALGMLIHFVMKLTRFLGSSTRTSLQGTGARP